MIDTFEIAPREVACFIFSFIYGSLVLSEVLFLYDNKNTRLLYNQEPFYFF